MDKTGDADVARIKEAVGMGAWAYCLGGIIAKGSQGDGVVCRCENEDVWLMMKARRGKRRMGEQRRTEMA